MMNNKARLQKNYIGIVDVNGDPISTTNRFPVTTDIIDDSGNPIASDNPFSVEIPPKISTVNSTTATLGAGGVFNGTYEMINGYGIVYVNIISDQASATDGLVIYQSSNGSDDDHDDKFTIPAASGKNFSINPYASHLRIQYTNGATPQTYFRLQVIFKSVGKSSSHRIQDSIIDDDDAELIKAVLSGKNPAGTFVNFQSTTAGNFKMSLEELESGISENTKTSLRTTAVDSSNNVIASQQIASESDNLDQLYGMVVAAALYGRLSSSLVRPLQLDDSTHAAKVMDYEHSEIHSNSHYFIEDYTGSAEFDDTDVIDFCLTTDNSTKYTHLVFDYESTGESKLDIYEGATLTANTGDLIVQRGNNRSKCYIGTHTAVASSSTVMTDSSASFVEDALIGWKIYNVTDGSYGIITDNTTTTVTVSALVGGTDNDWDTDDKYEINQSLTITRKDQTVTDVGHRLGGQQAGDSTNANRGIPGGQSRDKELVLRPNTSYIFRFTSAVNGNVLSYNAEWYEHTDKD